MVGKMKQLTPISKDEVTKKCGQAFWFVLGLAIAALCCLAIFSVIVWIVFKMFNLLAILIMEV